MARFINPTIRYPTPQSPDPRAHRSTTLRSGAEQLTRRRQPAASFARCA